MVGERSMRIETTGFSNHCSIAGQSSFLFFSVFCFLFPFSGNVSQAHSPGCSIDPNECQVFVAIIIKDSCLFCQDTRRKLFRRKFDERAKFYTSSAIWLPCDHFYGLGNLKPVCWKAPRWKYTVYNSDVTWNCIL